MLAQSATKKMEHVHHRMKVWVAVLRGGLVKIVKSNVRQGFLDLIVYKNVETADLMKIAMW